MKKIAFLFSLTILSQLVLFAADPVEGFWKSIDEKTGKITAYWNIYQKAGLLYGEIISLPDKPSTTIATDVKASYKGFPVAGAVNKMKVVGTPWIFGLSSKSSGVWAGGSIIDPEDGSMYKCKITFRPKDDKKFSVDSLEMRGEIGLGIGRSQFWVRAKESDWK